MEGNNIRVTLTALGNDPNYFEIVNQWCRENVRPYDWEHSNTTELRGYYFHKEEDAMLFILRWK